MLCNEFDPEREAVINPEDFHDEIENFPQLCIGIFSDKIIGYILSEYDADEIGCFKTCTGNIPIYQAEIRGQRLAFFLAYVGAPMAGGMMEELIAYGGKKFVFFGSCGVLRHDIADGHIIIPHIAVRDEGFSYHYIPAADEIALDPMCVDAAQSAMDKLALPYVKGKTWTTDAFYRETRKKIIRRKEQGCICVEMECAALAAVAKFRDVKFAQFLFAADSLDAQTWDVRGLSKRGEEGAEKYLSAALETGKRMTV